MFASFFNMLYPSKTFLTSVLNILHYNPSTYDIEELNNQMNEKEQCDLLNGSIDVSEINKKLPFKKFFIQNLLIKKTNFVFKRNFSAEKTKLFFEDITIDIYHKIKTENKNIAKEEAKKEEKKDLGGFLNNVINVVVHNLEVGFKNIIIKFYDKENKDVEYSLFIKNIQFKQAKDVQQIQVIDKGKYLFIHNKAIYIEKILFKEKFQENEQAFDWSQNLLKNENCIFYIGNEIELDIFHDKDNSILTLTNINSSKLCLENIFNSEQLSKIYYYFIKKEENEEKKEIKKIVKKKEEDIDIMGFKIKKINMEIKMDLLYCVLFEENKKGNIKEKKWISFEENIMKEENLKKGINTMNIIVEHFNTYKTKYYIFCINNVLFKLKDKIASVDNVSLNLINTDNIVNNEQNIYEMKNMIQITKFNFDNEKKELIYDNIYFEINNIFISLFKLILENSSDNKQINNENNNIVNNNDIPIKQEENKIELNKENNIILKKEEEIVINKNEEKKTYKINGQNFNIKIFIYKNLEENINKKSLNDIFNEKNDFDYINFVISNIVINNNITYDKFELTYNDIENKSVYCIFNLLDKLQKSQIKKEQNDEININLDLELCIFINPKIIKPLLDFYKTINKFIPKKEQIQINNDAEINNPNLLFNCDFKLNINLNTVKIILTENQKNNEEQNILNNENGMPQNEILLNDKNINNICFNFNKMNCKLEKNKDLVKFNFTMNPLIIQDNVYNSKYKIMFSNYDFKNENEIFINFDVNIGLNNNIKKYEIKPKIKIAPLAVYLDQVSLYFILNIFRQIYEKEKNEQKKDINNINNDNINFINNNVNDNVKYVISDFEIQKFFIELNYSTNKASSKDYEIIEKEMTSLLNTTSINKLKIIFEKYQMEENALLPIKDSIKKIYEFYSNSMLKQISGSLVTALPLFYHIYDSIDGMMDIVREPLDKYNKNESVADGFVQGVSSWVVKTATMFTYLGESIGSIFTFKGCTGDNDDVLLNKKEYNTCRQLRYLFDEDNKEKEEYYLKW